MHAQVILTLRSAAALQGHVRHRGVAWPRASLRGKSARPVIQSNISDGTRDINDEVIEPEAIGTPDPALRSNRAMAPVALTDDAPQKDKTRDTGKGKGRCRGKGKKHSQGSVDMPERF